MKFRDFVTRVNPRYRWYKHCEVLGRVLQRVADGEIKRLLVFMPPRHGKPLYNETMILMSNGSRKPIGAIEVGEYVITGKGRSRKVVGVFSQGNLPCLKITTETGRSVVAAHDHPFLTADGWVHAGKLKVGMALANVVSPQTHATFPDRMLEEYRLAGYFVGDGQTAFVSNGKGLAANITNADDLVLEDIKACAEAVGFGWNIAKPYGVTRATRINLTGGVRDWLRHSGLAGCTSFTKRVPSWVFASNDEQIAHFLAAYITCDGTVNRKGAARSDLCVELYSVDRELLADVQHLLLRLGVQSRIAVKMGRYKNEPHMSYRLTVTSQDDVARFKEKVPLVGEKLSRLKEWGVYRQRFDSGLRPDIIRAVEDAGVLPCTCITVEEDHTYTADDFVVHNTELISRLFTAYYLYRYPHRWVGVNSYGAELAYTLSRVARENFTRMGGEIKSDAAAVKHWETTDGGGFWAAGVGGPITGKGWHLGVIDDPLKNSEEAASDTIREKQKEWYGSTFYTREEPCSDADPNGALIVIQCMAGDTPVLMADGTEKALRDVRAGDWIATYDKGRLSAAKVLNWKNQGSDCTFTIRTSSGRIVRANERHPFLVERDGDTEWIRLKDLKIGDRILRAIGGSGAASTAPMRDATNPPSAKAIAPPITTKPGGQADIGRRRSILSREERRICDTDTASTSTSTMPFWKHRTESAPSAESRQPPTYGRIGAASSASIMTPRRERSEVCCATTVTSRSGTERRKRSCSGPLDTFAIVPDEVVEITPSGREDVFDIQVEGTENFVANGLISHNTRWHEDDLSGWLLAEEAGEEPEHWHVVSFEAIKEGKAQTFPATCTVEPDWREAGEALCPERRPVEKLLRIAKRIGGYFWSALFQQRPTAKAGSTFKVTRLEIVDAAPVQVQTTRFWDRAATDGGGDFTAGVKMAKGIDGLFYVLDVVRGQWDSAERDRTIRQTAIIDGQTVKVGGEQEPGSGGKDAARGFIQLLAGFNVYTEPASGSKEVRADAFSAQVNAGNVKLVKGEWNRAFIDELRQFPQGKHDDQVDAASGAFNDLTKAITWTMA